MLDLAKVTIDTFKPYLDEPFFVDLRKGEAMEVRLIEVTELPIPKWSKRPGFSVIFLGPKDKKLFQMIHKLEHKELGRMEIFLVPIPPVEEGCRYESIFA